MALLSGCAYVGPPRPPSLGIPAKVTDLTAYQRGGELVIGFSAPAQTTDDATLKKLRSIDLRAGPEGPHWEATARRIEVPTTEPGPVQLRVPVTPWIGQMVEIRVRASGKHGRFGEWSNEVRFKAVPPIEKPVVKAQAVIEGVRLSWTPSEGAEYRIYRQAPLETKPSLIATVTKGAEFIDSQTQYGKTYDYVVQAFIASGNSEAESEASAPVSITPEDVFPPAVPSGLTAVAGVSSIDLSWNPDTEPDLRGYYLYRSASGGPFERIGGLIETPSYSDRAIGAGKHYRYQVSAVDQHGNESARSPAVEAAAP
jgi:fibronectin type 3 domain-containing protein